MTYYCLSLGAPIVYRILTHWHSYVVLPRGWDITWETYA